MVGDRMVDCKVDMNKSQTESKRMQGKDFRKQRQQTYEGETESRQRQ